MGRLWRAIADDKRGSTVVEFALVSPIVIMLILAAVEFGSVMRANAGLRELSGWAGREAVVSYQVVGDTVIGANELKTRIETEARSPKYNLRNGRFNVDVTTRPNTALLTVMELRVRLRYNLPVSLPFLPSNTINFDTTRTYYVPNPATNRI